MEQLLEHFKKLGATLSTRQLTGLAVAFVAVVGVVVGSAYFISVPTFTLLMTDMDAETASTVMAELDQQDVPYQLSDAGRTISVPVERADKLRVDLASGGLLSGGLVGFELFDRPAFGTTDFIEQVNLRRALEGELARTIGTFAEISSARVHIVMSESSLFLDRSQPATASVALKLRGNRPLAPDIVDGIVYLLANSVQGLQPESIAVLDTYGRPLTRSADESTAAASGVQLEREMQLEQDLRNRVVSLLEPVVGLGRVRVNVSADLDNNLVEQTAEVFDPATVLLSSETITDVAAGGQSVGGPAGALANQAPDPITGPDPTAADLQANPNATPVVTTPPTQTATLGTTTPPSNRIQETMNFEVGKTTTHTVTPQGQLARLSVAVILDDERVTSTDPDGTVQVTTRPWDPDGIQRIEGLVAAAVGLDVNRGDQLIVENIAFEAPEIVPDPVPPGIGEQVMDGLKQYGPSALRVTGIIAIALFALLGIIRPLTKTALVAASASAPALPAAGASTARLPTVGQMEGEMETPQVEAGPNSKVPALSQRVAQLASDEPEQLAGIVRGWIAEGDR